MPITSLSGNKYLMTSINDYTKMCWVYLLKQKSKAFKTFKNFHLWVENEAHSHIGTLSNDNGKNIPLMNLKTIFVNMGLCIKPLLHRILKKMM